MRGASQETRARGGGARRGPPASRGVEVRGGGAGPAGHPSLLAAPVLVPCPCGDVWGPAGLHLSHHARACALGSSPLGEKFVAVCPQFSFAVPPHPFR